MTLVTCARDQYALPFLNLCGPPDLYVISGVILHLVVSGRGAYHGAVARQRGRQRASGRDLPGPVPHHLQTTLPTAATDGRVRQDAQPHQRRRPGGERIAAALLCCVVVEMLKLERWLLVSGEY